MRLLPIPLVRSAASLPTTNGRSGSGVISSFDSNAISSQSNSRPTIGINSPAVSCTSFSGSSGRCKKPQTEEMTPNTEGHCRAISQSTAVNTILVTLEAMAIGTALAMMTNFSHKGFRMMNAAPTQAAKNNDNIRNPLHASATRRGLSVKLITTPSGTAGIPRV